jgi:hypothetical protein
MQKVEAGGRRWRDQSTSERETTEGEANGGREVRSSTTAILLVLQYGMGRLKEEVEEVGEEEEEEEEEKKRNAVAVL